MPVACIVLSVVLYMPLLCGNIAHSLYKDPKPSRLVYPGCTLRYIMLLNVQRLQVAGAYYVTTPNQS